MDRKIQELHLSETCSGQLQAGQSSMMAGLRAVIHKGRSVGHSGVSTAQPVIKLRHLLLYLPELLGEAGRQLDFPMLIGQITCVLYFKVPAGKVQETNHVPVFHQRAADIVDLSAAIFTARIGQEKDVVEGNRPGGQVDKVPVRILPDSVEFGLDEHAGCLPDRPAYQLFSALSDHVLWNDTETFEHWLASQRLAWNIHGVLVCDNMPAEVENMA